MFFLGCGMVEQGWATRARRTGAAKASRSSCAAWTCVGAPDAILEFPHCWASLADAYAAAPAASTKRSQAVAEGLDASAGHVGPLQRSRAVPAQGELLLAGAAAPRHEDAERCFRQALEIARRQSAKSIELRAATSWSRLLQRQGKREDARRLLAEVYAWFTEGFDTADLKRCAGGARPVGEGHRAGVIPSPAHLPAPILHQLRPMAPRALASGRPPAVAGLRGPWAWRVVYNPLVQDDLTA